MEIWTVFLVLVAGAGAQWNSGAALAPSSTSSSLALPSGGGTCDISEFRCSSKSQDGQLCLPMDRWCNGNVDCDNRVDEPRSCTSKRTLKSLSLYFPAQLPLILTRSPKRKPLGHGHCCPWGPPSRIVPLSRLFHFVLSQFLGPSIVKSLIISPISSSTGPNLQLNSNAVHSIGSSIYWTTN